MTKPLPAKPKPVAGAARQPSLAKRITRSPRTHRFIAGWLRGIFKTAHWIGRERASDAASAFARLWGPLIPEHRLALRNLALAFPEKSEAERRAILSGVWDNLARATIEYAFLDDIVASFDPEHPDVGPVTAGGMDHLARLRDGGRPGIVFGAHVANWELSAAIGARLGLKITALYRTPTNSIVAEELAKQRATFINRLVVSGRGTAFQIAAAIERGEHLGIIIDQRAGGLMAPFFGRPASTNPAVAMLARQFDCPVHGSRAIRRPDGGFHIDMTPPLDLPRDAKGRVDVAAGTAMINRVVEGWVREHPEQWLWLHDRWKASPA